MNDHSERGSGTTLALGAVSVILILFVFITGLFGAMTAKQRASTAADLSALAAADAARGLREGEPCDVAAQVAEDNRAQVTGCAAPSGRQGTIDVRVTSKISGPFAFLGDAEAISRAGPPTD